MHYLIDMGDGETYAVCNSGTVRWISDKPLRFNVVACAGFNDEDVNVYTNGKALSLEIRSDSRYICISGQAIPSIVRYLSATVFYAAPYRI